MTRTRGFTIIELVVAIIFLVFVAGLLITQRANLAAAQRDNQRKTAVNAMYYALEKVYYDQNKFYPTTIDSAALSSVDPMLFIDPNGNKLGGPGAEYRYEPARCQDNKCQTYTLRADLEKEADYVKRSPNG